MHVWRQQGSAGNVIRFAFLIITVWVLVGKQIDGTLNVFGLDSNKSICLTKHKNSTY